jgi:hypothetical protein
MHLSVCCHLREQHSEPLPWQCQALTQRDGRRVQIQSAGVSFEDLNGPLTAALEAGPKPTVAAITGAALGGGLEVAMACNARVCESPDPLPPSLSPPPHPYGARCALQRGSTRLHASPTAAAAARCVVEGTPQRRSSLSYPPFAPHALTFRCLPHRTHPGPLQPQPLARNPSSVALRQNSGLTGVWEVVGWGGTTAGTPQSMMGLPELSLGIIPGFGGTQRLPRLVGVQTALQMMLTSKPLKAPAAAKAGLVRALPLCLCSRTVIRLMRIGPWVGDEA